MQDAQTLMYMGGGGRGTGIVGQVPLLGLIRDIFSVSLSVKS